MPAVTQDDAIPSLALTGEALYDAIMGGIEPELVTASLPTLSEKYKNETPDQTDVRAARYQKAFKVFQDKLKEYEAAWGKRIASFKSFAMRFTEQGNKQTDAEALQSLEASFDSPSA